MTEIGTCTLCGKQVEDNKAVNHIESDHPIEFWHEVMLPKLHKKLKEANKE